ncbi:ABC transporter permease [Caloranaerobacter azorensis]|uniref:ABC transporter permease n=1 Tax=Caloranaerobacter azorensis TaxID=116090 RepID=A0A6P1YCC7_9FIRM|nr:ABC transporter permease [Caloranaerobacter azorensis]QIB27030.1 ABC transporter permease [Caloranaerobacter azorensis]
MTELNGKVVEISESKFRIIGCDNQDSEKINRKSITYWEDVWRRFKSNKVAVGAVILLVTIILFTIIGPMISGYDFQKMDSSIKNQPPSAQHWFGTDDVGRDLFSRVSIGGRVSIAIGISCAAIVIVIGAIYGGISGYLGGVVDDIMMRIVEIIGSIPYLILVILISLILGKGMIPLIIAMTITAWGGTARMVRGQVLQIKEQDFVLAERCLGASTARIITKHLLPNTLGLILVQVSFQVPGFIFGEAFLSYIGLGVQPPDTSWGALASAAQENLMFYPYQLFFPCLFIALTMLSFSLIGDGLTDALDPKLRQ